MRSVNGAAYRLRCNTEIPHRNDVLFSGYVTPPSKLPRPEAPLRGERRIVIPFFDFLPFRNPSREEFAERVLTALEKAGTDKKYLYDPAEFRITNGSRVVELADMYAMYCATPPLQRKARLSELAIAITQAAEELPADFASAKSRLVPTLRSPIEAAFLTLRSGAPWKN